MSNINETFKNRLNELNNTSGLKPPKAIKDDTFRKYLRGQRFPSSENLEIIKEHYHVSYDYLFGVFDNTNEETIDISREFGLDEDVINKLKDINKNDNQFVRENKKYAINTFLRYLDFEKLGLLLLFPSYKNKHITSSDYYSNYSKYFKLGIDNQLVKEIKNNDELSNYKIYKQVSMLCELSKRSKHCIDRFKKLVEEGKKIEDKYFDNMIENFNEEDLYNINYVDMENPFKNEAENIIQKREKDIEI